MIKDPTACDGIYLLIKWRENWWPFSPQRTTNARTNSQTIATFVRTHATRFQYKCTQNELKCVLGYFKVAIVAPKKGSQRDTISTYELQRSVGLHRSCIEQKVHLNPPK